MTQNDDSCLRDEIRSHDDLRSGSDLILITDSTDSKSNFCITYS